jgi:hypothetical protein
MCIYIFMPICIYSLMPICIYRYTDLYKTPRPPPASDPAGHARTRKHVRTRQVVELVSRRGTTWRRISMLVFARDPQRGASAFRYGWGMTAHVLQHGANMW